MEIKLKTINIEDKEKLLEMLKEYEESELIPNIDRYEGIRSFELLNDMKFEEWLAKIKKEEITCPKEFSTHTLYMAFDENDQIIGYEYVHIGKMMQYIKSGIPAMEAIEKASGKYGRFDEAVKKIDPRKE